LFDQQSQFRGIQTLKLKFVEPFANEICKIQTETTREMIRRSDVLITVSSENHCIIRCNYRMLGSEWVIFSMSSRNITRSSDLGLKLITNVKMLKYNISVATF
jgi:hypothetical protein